MDAFFRYLNLAPLPLWLAMWLAPHHPLTERASRADSVFALMAANYAAALALALRSGPGGLRADIWRLDVVRAMLGTRPGAQAAWAHMLALDLFTGAWIYRQCLRLNAPAWVRLPALVLAYATGPLGLLLFLAWRGSVNRR